MRLQVFLSQSGICSRRKALELIKQARVKVNGHNVIEASFSIDSAKDVVTLDEKKVSLKEKIYIILNKPKGIVTTHQDRHAKKIIFDLLPACLRHLHTVGRLDKDSQGLLILTNDGELAFRLMHPRFLVNKQYLVRINKDLTSNHKTALEKGIILDSKRTSAADIRLKDGCNLTISIHEGKKRQIRRMFLKFGLEVLSLKRIAYGPLNLGSVAEGKWRSLSEQETKALFKCVGLEK